MPGEHQITTGMPATQVVNHDLIPLSLTVAVVVVRTPQIRLLLQEVQILDHKVAVDTKPVL